MGPRHCYNSPMSRLFALILVLLVTALMLPAADVTGTWKGSYSLSGQTVPVTIELKSAADGLVVGTVQGMSTSDPDIRDGKVAGDDLSFFINVDFEGEAARLVFKGKVTGDEIHFDMRMDTGGWGAQLSVKKS